MSNHFLIGDALENLKSIEGEQIQTWIFDPPYNIGFRYDNVDDNLSWEDYTELIQSVASLMFEHTLEGGSCFMVHNKIATARLLPFFEQAGWNVHQWIDWVYASNMGMSKQRFTHGSRAVLWLTKGTPYVNIKACPGEYKNPNDKRIQARMEQGHFPALMDWWNINLRKNVSKGHRGYANQLPFELVKRCILTTTKPGQVVGDCMGGSGTTYEVAKTLNRFVWLNDINPKSIDLWREI